MRTAKAVIGKRKCLFVAVGLCVAGCFTSFVGQSFPELSDALLGEDFSDIQETPGVSPPSVAGTYEWVAGIMQPRMYTLTGTITLEQQGALVRVVDTTHSNPANRQLEGEAELSGNVLRIQMVPQNGDTDYAADVKVVFSTDGDRFVVDFSDTNGDSGQAHAVRRSSPK